MVDNGRTKTMVIPCQKNVRHVFMYSTDKYQKGVPGAVHYCGIRVDYPSKPKFSPSCRLFWSKKNDIKNISPCPLIVRTFGARRIYLFKIVVYHIFDYPKGLISHKIDINGSFLERIKLISKVRQKSKYPYKW